LKKRIITVIQYLFFLLIGLTLLWLVFRKLDLSEVASEIRNARYEWLLLAFFFGLLSHIMRAFRWNILIRSMGYPAKISTTFYAVMVGYLANAAFPRLGEVTRCGVLSKKTNTPFNALFGTVISERVFDLFVLVLIILGVIFLQLDFLRGFVDKYFLSNLSGMMNSRTVLLLIVVVILCISLPILLFRIFYKRIREVSLYRKASDFVKGLMDGIKTIARIRHKFLFILLTLIIWTLYVLMTYTVFFSLKATSGLTFFDGITIMALGSLGIVAPVPGGIGAYQFIVKAILVEIYMIASEPAASYSIIAWTTQTILILVMGLISYYIMVFKKPELKNDTA
jgi:uncharacterized protein (TIRG00374 family)